MFPWWKRMYLPKCFSQHKELSGPCREPSSLLRRKENLGTTFGLEFSKWSRSLCDSRSGRRPCASLHVAPKIGIRADFPLCVECSIKKTLSPAVCPEIFFAAQEGGRFPAWAGRLSGNEKKHFWLFIILKFCGSIVLI